MTMTERPSSTVERSIDTALVPAERPAQTSNMSTTIRSLQPQSFAELMQFADAICRSPFIPKEFVGKPGDILAAVQYGAELSMPAMQALQSICVINGKPSVYGDAMLAIVRRSGLLEAFEEGHDTDSKGVVTGAWCMCKRKGYPAKTTHFSMDDAKRANLAAKSIWLQYPQRMMTMRARSWCLRDTFADVLKGMQCVEEVMDYTIDVTEQSYAPPTIAPRPAVPASRGVEAVKAQIASKKPGEEALERFTAVAVALGKVVEGRKEAVDMVREILRVDAAHKLTAAEIDEAAQCLSEITQDEGEEELDLADETDETESARFQFMKVAVAAGYPIQSGEDAEALVCKLLQIPDGSPLTEASFRDAIEALDGQQSFGDD